MTYIDIVKGKSQIECLKKGTAYHYYIKDNGDEPFEFQSQKSPKELSIGTEIGKSVKRRFEALSIGTLWRTERCSIRDDLSAERCFVMGNRNEYGNRWWCDFEVIGYGILYDT